VTRSFVIVRLVDASSSAKSSGRATARSLRTTAAVAIAGPSSQPAAAQPARTSGSGHPGAIQCEPCRTAARRRPPNRVNVPPGSHTTFASITPSVATLHTAAVIAAVPTGCVGWCQFVQGAARQKMNTNEGRNVAPRGERASEHAPRADERTRRIPPRHERGTEHDDERTRVVSEGQACTACCALPSLAFSRDGGDVSSTA